MAKDLTEWGRSPSKIELAAAVTFNPRGTRDIDYDIINRTLRESPRQFQVGDVEIRDGEYVLPLTWRETGETNYLPVAEQVSGDKRYQRYFKSAIAINPPLANPGEITDLVGKPAREALEGLLELRKKYGNPKELQKYAELNTSDYSIHGVGDLRNLILLNEYLATRNTRTLIHSEGMEEDKKGNLSNGVWRMFGTAVYSENGPNSELSQTLIREGKRRGWKTPLLVHPSALELSDNGLEIHLREDFSPELVTHGEEARIDLNKFHWVEDSGARRLDRDSYGSWVADLSDVFNSNENFRMTWPWLGQN